MDKKKDQQINFRLERVTTEQFSIDEEVYDEAGSKSKINLNVRFNYALNSESKIVSVFTGFKFEMNGVSFLIIEAGGHFLIKEEDWNDMLSPENNKITLPKGFVQHMAMITVGTTRGILHAKTDGTEFNRFLIPTINLTEIIRKDVVLEVN
ncbi:MAG: hypothetical protein K9J21_05890 [Bacteroidales bacterium]|nr:hypothetical protein [Bacteroidales bacterium]